MIKYFYVLILMKFHHISKVCYYFLIVKSEKRILIGPNIKVKDKKKEIY